MYTDWFEHAEPDRARYGGKGASLIALRRAGFPVPTGFCVPVEGYRQIATLAGIGALIDAAASDPALLRQPEPAKQLAAAILDRLHHTALPAAMEEAFAAAFHTLAEGPGTPAVAVRSSAVAEDGHGASFAGMYESYLGLRTYGAAREALAACYASLWQPRAIQYRAAMKIGQADEAMAVVVMEMVPAVAAGVAFSANPVTGSRAEVVINAAWGLGEGVVSGRVNPDHIVAQKSDGAVLDYTVGDKAHAVVAGEATDGTQQATLAHDMALARVMTDDDVRAVVALVREVEEFYGRPQDIEFAHAGRGWQLLQARPITGLGD